MKTNVILIGLGSIGKTHLKYLTRYFYKIVIVDVNENVIGLNLDLIGDHKYEYLQTLKDYKFEKGYIKHAVIANWGPDHFSTFEELVDLGVVNFIIEKPVAVSFEDLDKMRSLKRKHNLKILSNFQWSHGPFVDNLNFYASEFTLGKVCNIVVHGGAKCIATNGIHYLALADLVFSSHPIYTFGSLNSSQINPRNKDFLFIGGVSNWTYSNDRQLTIIFSNESSNSATMTIIFENGLAEVKGNQIKFLGFDKPFIDSNFPKTRTSYASVNLIEIEAFTSNEFDGQEKIYEIFIGDNALDNFEASYNVTRNLLANLLSNERKKYIYLDRITRKFSKVYRRSWKIS
jgi:predicted dehydrogenase